MKILVAGDGGSPLHEIAVAKAFRSLGHEVHEFHWRGYFAPSAPARAQNRFLIGPRFTRLNRDFLARARAFRPDLVFLYRGTHITPSTLRALKRELPAAVLTGYNNDDPFGPQHPRWMWRHFTASLPHYDIVFAYRPHNVDEFRAAGAKRAELLMPWYAPEDGEPAPAAPRCDVVFAGHFEHDSRLGYLEALVESGVELKLYGPDWDRAPRLPWLAKFQPVRPARGHAYYAALRSARIALSFFSRLNRDRYTRRSFEIPFAGTFMLSEHSDEIARIFRPGIEADYFSGPADLVEKVRYYLTNERSRAAIAAAGHHRVLGGGHDVVSRMHDVLAHVTTDAG